MEEHICRTILDKCGEYGHPVVLEQRTKEMSYWVKSQVNHNPLDQLSYTICLPSSTIALHCLQNGACVLVSGRRFTSRVDHIPRASLASRDHIVHSLADPVCVLIETQVSQHHASTEQQRSRVRLVFALDVKTDVSAAGLEHGDFTTHVAAGDDTGSADETGTDVGENTTVEVGRDHDVELLGAGYTLHAGVVHNHVVGDDTGVVLPDALDSVAEKTVGKLHDVGLVDNGDLLAVVGEGERVGELGDTFRLCAGDDLERLDDTVDGGVF